MAHWGHVGYSHEDGQAELDQYNKIYQESSFCGHMYTGKIWWSGLGLTNYNGQPAVTCVGTHFICKFSNNARDLCCESHLLTNNGTFTTWYPQLINDNE